MCHPASRDKEIAMTDNTFRWAPAYSAEVVDPDAPTLARGWSQKAAQLWGHGPVVDYPPTGNGWYDNLGTATVAAPRQAAPRQASVRHKSRMVAGLLCIVAPPGCGRKYLGYQERGNWLLSCWLGGILGVCSLIGAHLGIAALVYSHVSAICDGLMLLVGDLIPNDYYNNDGQGRPLRWF
jgi:hypothetical protein